MQNVMTINQTQRSETYKCCAFPSANLSYAKDTKDNSI